MSQAAIELNAEVRTPGTKNVARRLRAAGQVPAVLYGFEKAPVALACDPKPLLAVVHSESGHNRILNVAVKGGENTSAVVQDWQVDPVSDRLLHVDLRRIDLTKKIRVRIAVHALGEAKGVKVQGGILEFVQREVEVECLPLDIPDFISADVTELVVGKSLRIRDLVVDSKLKVLGNPDQVVAHIITIKEEEVKAPEEAAVVAGAAPAEPEVIKKGKKEVEGEGEEGAAKPEAKGEKSKPEAKGEKKK
jgi:large subunit ribosomal protein L25